ncbi:hypothetical protein LTR62_001146 [Meristemomyces frigidus]|uniref:Uncharacterized protein n=1 Tax=Meristemomyces frigidus TaxID=1508187 RepID=A0AAN7TGM1_9PEZI|nr:hypothetical protein LTR62_001146 [Meristemomyces frigidus]
MALPAELRLHIYDHILLPNMPIQRALVGDRTFRTIPRDDELFERNTADFSLFDFRFGLSYHGRRWSGWGPQVVTAAGSDTVPGATYSASTMPGRYASAGSQFRALTRGEEVELEGCLRLVRHEFLLAVRGKMLDAADLEELRGCLAQLAGVVADEGHTKEASSGNVEEEARAADGVSLSPSLMQRSSRAPLAAAHSASVTSIL